MIRALLPEISDQRSRLRLNLALYVLALLAAAGVVVVTVTIVNEKPWADDSTSQGVPSMPADDGLSVGPLAEASEEEEQRVADVLESAEGLTTALINVHHEDVDGAIEELSSLTTGKFREEIVSATGGMRQLFTESRSIQKGTVVWSAIESADQDSARALVATTGTVANKTTQGKATARNYRLLLSLVREDGEWLTTSVEFVT